MQNQRQVELAQHVNRLCPRGPSESLFGPQAKPARRDIRARIAGAPVKAAQCGFYATMQAIYETFPVTGWTCQADRDDKTTQLIRNLADQSK